LRRLQIRRLSEAAYLREPHRLIVERQQRVDQLEMRLAEIWKGLLHQRRSQLGRLAAFLSAFRPEQWLQAKRGELATLEARLKWTAGSRLEAHRNHLAEFAGFLRLLGPKQTLERGYSITLDSNGAVIRSAHLVKSGERIQTKLADGELYSIVAGPKTG
ncbi:MAG TPA: exodeoxyribonuclease VII large subunit, partial [Chthoniobacterales bacterium]|nr:exodeoxyribonuclease VII large subunit [Chthoniobacterales bacterium]